MAIHEELPAARRDLEIARFRAAEGPSVLVSTEATATCSLRNPFGRFSNTDARAAFIALRVKEVVTRSPPPSISLSVNPAARSDSFLRVAGIFRSPVLGLQKVHVAASRNVERMPPRAEDAPYVAHEWLAAVPDRAEKCD